MRELRAKEQAITEIADMKRILASTFHITVAMCENNEPYLVTLTHGYDQKKNALYFHCSKEGKKIDIWKTNNAVWGQAMLDKGRSSKNCDYNYATTQFYGKVSFVTDLVEKKHALKLMISQLNKQSYEEATSSELTEDKIRNVTIGRIDIEYLSGKKSLKNLVLFD